MKLKAAAWARNNLTAILLVALFIPVFIWTQNMEDAVKIIGTTSIEYLNKEFYRWFTCIFFHYSYDHIIFNSLAWICIGSLINQYTGKIRTAIIFLLGGALAEIPFSIIVKYGEANYGGGSSGGIYALIAAFLVCWLRFGQEKKIKWYRPDLIVTVLFFILANDNESSFLTHSFGFIAGIVIGTVMVITRLIKKSVGPEGKNGIQKEADET